IFIALGIFGIFSVLPLVLTVSNAFKPLHELFLFPPRFIVRNPTLDNFSMLFSLLSNSWVPFSRYFFNTVFITVAGTLGHILVCSLAAYPLAKHPRMPGNKVIFQMIILSMMFHTIVTDVVNYITMSSIGFIDTYLAIIVPAFGGSFGMFLMRQFMTQIPDSLLEAAKIDGAGEYRIFWQIVMPNVKSAWLTLAIFSVQGLWNGQHTTYIYREELKTMPYAMSQIVAGGIIRAGAHAAVNVVMMVVPITFFIVSQSKIIETMATSGMKE
ncbi:MAG TPA: carbohydrate ABC transporter permease, partial [Clostridiales bacterium]|nr:carbohydrate ABC transporter permease [Clostridiales bacterium]